MPLSLLPEERASLEASRAERWTRRNPVGNFDPAMSEVKSYLGSPVPGLKHSFFASFCFTWISVLLTTKGSVTTELSHSLEELPVLLTQCRAFRPGSHRRG